jgi:metal-sulfur cluster biosynthetic enzyme
MITESQVIEKLRGVYDPEIPINLYDLGLIYSIGVDENTVTIDMSLTTMLRPEAIEVLGENHPLAQMATGV